MELVRSLTKSLGFSLNEEEEGVEENVAENEKQNEDQAHGYDSRACLTCSNPCDVHEFVNDAMLGKINYTKPILGLCATFDRCFLICTGTPGVHWTAKPNKVQNNRFDHVYKKFSSFLKQHSEEKEKKDILFLVSDLPADVLQAEDKVDLIVFPQRVRYENVGEEDFKALLNGDQGNLKKRELTHKHHLYVW